MRKSRILFAIGAMILGVLAPGSAAASKDDVETWRLNVRFTVGVADYSADEKEKIHDWIQEQVDRAEALYDRKPALEISKTVVRQTHAGGRELAVMKFNSGGKYARFMDENFDTIASSRTEGYLQVLIVDKVCVGYRKNKATGKRVRDCQIGGRATFPHWVSPLTRKHGIIQLYPDPRDHTLAHEFGHFFAVKHTFEPYTGVKLLCNKDYDPVIGKPDAGKCNSCRGTVTEENGRKTCSTGANVMDYCDGDDPQMFLNACQETRASNQRKTYMTRDGATDYYAMKGRLGEAICEDDKDCGDGEYCFEGVVTIGRNVCKESLADWQACTRGGQCQSGLCKSALCYTPDSIAFGNSCHFNDECKKGQCSSGPAGQPAGKCVCSDDADCASGEYCNKGVAGIGTNVCKPKLTNWKACTNGDQCQSGLCKSALCYTPDSIAFGSSCHFNDECKKGQCSSGPAGQPAGKCVCSDDADCASGEYCNKGVAGIGTNVCKPKLADWKACTNGDQCQSGRCKTALCSTPNSVAFGNTCHFTDECKKGKCSSGPAGQPAGKCVCEADGDCGSGEYCNKGVGGIGTNVCKDKLAKGKACTQPRQCKSGKCSFFKCK